MVHVIDPFALANPLWLGLDDAGFRRKVFKVVDENLLESRFLTAGLTIFEPGESSSLHNHPESEEINLMFIPKGVRHQHINTGREPLWLVFVDGPHGQVPTS